MLAYVSEVLAWRCQGSVPYTMAQVQRTKIPAKRQETKIEKQGFVLAFRKTRVRLYVYVLLNASGIAKNGGCPPFS